MNTDDAPNYERDNEIWDWIESVSPNQFKNLLAFIMLVSDESPGVLNVAPTYILEKWGRFIGTELPDDTSWQTGIHPTLRAYFDAYCRKWRLH